MNKKENKNKRESKIAHGEFKNVLLTDEEHAELSKRLNGSSAKYIESLSGYLAQHPRKKYDSHYATILNWYRKDTNESDKKRQLCRGSPGPSIPDG